MSLLRLALTGTAKVIGGVKTIHSSDDMNQCSVSSKPAPQTARWMGGRTI